MDRVKLRNGELLTIEQANPDDAAELLQFLTLTAGETDNLVSTPASFQSMTVEQERDWLRAQAASQNSVVLCGKAGGRVVSVASLIVPAPQRVAHTAEFAVSVGRAYWNIGAGSAMTAALLRWAKERPGLKLIHLGVRADNEAAIHLYWKHGFREIGRFTGYICVDGEYFDQVLMELVL